VALLFGACELTIAYWCLFFFLLPITSTSEPKLAWYCIRYPRTRLFACVCLIAVERAFPVYFQETQIKNKLILVLLDLIEESDHVGDEAPFVLKGLIEESEELHKQMLSLNAAERLCGYLSKGKTVLEARRLGGILLVLSELSSKLEQSRAKFIELQVCSFALFKQQIVKLVRSCIMIQYSAVKKVHSTKGSLAKSVAGTIYHLVLCTPLLV
jgi:hypothetical protein